jgi:N-methylhydantoinase A
MQSSGGLLPPEGIARRPLEMLESGPAAGVTAALAVARALDDPDVITLDMGGTSTDVCLITGGRAEQSSGRSLDGLPLGISSLDIVNIGAGGGSLGYVDAGGMLQVGPQSAGAHPGPACYGMGGTAPALTDALVALGWLRPEAFLGGAMTLDADAADRALAALDAGAADAMIRIAVAHIARAISQVSVQRGRDPRGHAIYAFGGMGPVLGALVAEELRIDRVVVPVHAGLFSALGLLLADLRRTYEQTELIALRGGRERLEQGFRRLERQAVGEFAGYGYPGDAIRFTRTVAMRYEGQGFELTVPFADDLEGAFHDAHRTAYGTAVPAKPIEVVTLRLEAAIPRVNAPDTSMPVTAAKPVRDSVEWQGARRECVFAPRGSVTELDGLAVIEADTTTAVVPPAWRATASPDGSLVLQR